MEALTKTHNFLFDEIADSRVLNWPLMSNPWKMTAILILYIATVLWWLPSYMEKRKPYSLKPIIRAYNVFEIVVNVTVVHRLAVLGWATHYSWGCQPVDPLEDQMASFMWWIAMLKIVQLMETILYALRKKYNQISVLHVYHHVATPLVAWILAKYFPGGMGSFGWLLNSSAHALMYSYYFMSSFGPQIQRKLRIVKSKLTLIQIIQLTAIMIHASQALSPNCAVPNMFACVILSHVSINLALFCNFYMRSYVKNKNA